MTTNQAKLQQFVESGAFGGVVLVLILANAVILGAETFAGFPDDVTASLYFADRLILYAFVVEIAIRIGAWRLDYFKTGWNLFDFVVVLISLLAATSGLGALRAFRVLRVLRVVTVIPRMRVVVSALFDSLPGIASVGVVLALIVYVFAVIASNLYGADHPGLFGDVFTAMYTLFQVMTLEGWPDIASRVGETHPRSWVFFLSFLLLATFTMLNLFVAIVVRVVEEDSDPWFDDIIKNQEEMVAELAALRREVASLAKSRDADGR
ncbi:MAG: ion transporter [Pseudomonadota bacterium]